VLNCNTLLSCDRCNEAPACGWCTTAQGGFKCLAVGVETDLLGQCDESDWQLGVDKCADPCTGYGRCSGCLQFGCGTLLCDRSSSLPLSPFIYLIVVRVNGGGTSC